MCLVTSSVSDQLWMNRSLIQLQPINIKRCSNNVTCTYVELVIFLAVLLHLHVLTTGYRKHS